MDIMALADQCLLSDITVELFTDRVHASLGYVPSLSTAYASNCKHSELHQLL